MPAVQVGAAGFLLKDARPIGLFGAKTHVGRILTKTESRDRIQAVVLAHREGLVATD